MAYFAQEQQREVRIGSPVYPADQQVQLYKVKPVPFVGESTADADYVRYDLDYAQAKRARRPQPREQPNIPFTGRSTSASDFVAHPESGPRQPFKEDAVYVPSKAPFYASTTAGETYVKYDLKGAQSERARRPQPREQPNIPFTGRSTSASDFVAHPGSGPRQPMREQTVYVPSSAPFFDQTTSGDAYQRWNVQPKRAGAPPYKPHEVPNIPFEGQSTQKADFRRWSLGKRRLSVGIALNGGIFYPLVSGVERLPASVTEIVTTVTDNQRSALLLLYQGEREIARENLLIGTLKIPDIDRAPAGFPRFQVHLSIDESNSLSLRVENLETGRLQHATFTTHLVEEAVRDHISTARKLRDEDRNHVNQIRKALDAQGGGGGGVKPVDRRLKY